ncbi:MAG: C40 family peptidase [Bacteroidia bacterium]|nr:C40 family peptidase [Bacteroidia bacterium]MDW8158302.1 C40 family peptidase [Bacteroidia bacterium]
MLGVRAKNDPKPYFRVGKNIPFTYKTTKTVWQKNVSYSSKATHSTQNQHKNSFSKPYQLTKSSKLVTQVSKISYWIQEKQSNVLNFFHKISWQQQSKMLRNEIEKAIYHTSNFNLDVFEFQVNKDKEITESSASSINQLITNEVFVNCIQPLEAPPPKTLKIIDQVPVIENCLPTVRSSQEATLDEDKFFSKKYRAPKTINNKSTPYLTFKILDGLNEVSIFQGIRHRRILNNNIAHFFQKNFGILLTEEDNLKIYEFAAKWLHTPYVWGGQSERGVDCSGLALIFADSIYKIRIPRVAGDILAVCQILEKQDLHEGDFVFFNRGNYIFHMGIYLKNNKFFHASLAGGVIIDDLNSPYYRRYYYCGGRLKNSNSSRYN